jgi:hypothetical protein
MTVVSMNGTAKPILCRRRRPAVGRTGTALVADKPSRIEVSQGDSPLLSSDHARGCNAIY